MVFPYEPRNPCVIGNMAMDLDNGNMYVCLSPNTEWRLAPNAAQPVQPRRDNCNDYIIGFWLLGILVGLAIALCVGKVARRWN